MKYLWEIEDINGNITKEQDGDKETIFTDVDNSSISILRLVSDAAIIETNGNVFTIYEGAYTTISGFTVYSKESDITPLLRNPYFLQFKGFVSNAFGVEEIKEKLKLDLTTTSHHIGFRKWFLKGNKGFHIDFLFNIVLNEGVSISCKVYGLKEGDISILGSIDNGITTAPLNIPTEFIY